MSELFKKYQKKEDYWAESTIETRKGHLKPTLLAENREFIRGCLLDCGCHKADTLYYALPYVTSAMAIDINLKALNYAKNSYKKLGITKVDFRLACADDIPASDNTFDTVLMLDVYEHLWLEDVPAILTEIKRVMKPGAHLVMDFPRSKKGSAEESSQTGAFAPQHVQNFFTEADFKPIIEKYFKIVKLEHIQRPNPDPSQCACWATPHDMWLLVGVKE